jgi:hypothetical protein
MEPTELVTALFLLFFCILISGATGGGVAAFLAWRFLHFDPTFGANAEWPDYTFAVVAFASIAWVIVGKAQSPTAQIRLNVYAILHCVLRKERKEREAAAERLRELSEDAETRMDDC